MTTSKVATEVLPNGHHGHNEWSQITPRERFKIRTSVKEAEGPHTTLELVENPRNGVPNEYP
jgi:hypothetical protein